jgi:hypothetical protein
LELLVEDCTQRVLIGALVDPAIHAPGLLRRGIVLQVSVLPPQASRKVDLPADVTGLGGFWLLLLSESQKPDPDHWHLRRNRVK